MNRRDLLLFRRALRGRQVQRELPSTITNGQELGRMFQRKMFRAFLKYFFNLKAPRLSHLPEKSRVRGCPDERLPVAG
jgi:hypothetical protein